MAGTKESCEELDVNREQAEKSSPMAIVSQVLRIAKVTMDMNAKLASLDGQRQQLKDILRGYGKRKRQIKDNTKALFKKAKKLKENACFRAKQLFFAGFSPFLPPEIPQAHPGPSSEI